MKKINFDHNPALVDEVTEELAKDPVLKKFFIDHDIQNQTIVNHLNDLMTYKMENPKCFNCEGLHVCEQDTLGHRPVLTYQDQKIMLAYQACNFLKSYEKKQVTKQKINAMYMPQMIHQATLADFHMNKPLRKDLYQKLMAIISHVKLKQDVKGLYLSGQYQIGKTYTLAALANQFATMNLTIIIAYYPDLVREIKSSIKTGNLEEMIANLKNTDILMLDDIAGESPSQWIRDEVLGPILQHRLLDQKLTFFTSNVPLKELNKHLVETSQQAEQMKAYRIVERIKALTEEFTMS